MITIQGKGVSTGVAAGPLYFYQRAKGTFTRHEVEDREAEWLRFKEAQAKAIEQLGELAEKARAEAGDEAAMLFETHQMMCEDLDYEEAIEGFIKEQGLNAEAAVTIAKGEKSVNALKLMALMQMGIKQGDTVKVTVEGGDEEAVAAAIEAFFKANL